MTGQALKDLSRPVLGWVFFLGGRGVERLFWGYFMSIKLLMACPDNMQAAENHALPQPGERGCWHAVVVALPVLLSVAHSTALAKRLLTVFSVSAILQPWHIKLFL